MRKKASNIVVYDVSTTSPICSYIIVATMMNTRHGKSLADACVEVQEKLGQESCHVEGTEKDPWILIDLKDIIIHLFIESERQRVDLDSLIKKVNKNG